MSVLASGSEVQLVASGRRATVRRLLGEGSQGAVYEAAVGPSGERLALKWYFPHLAHPFQRAAIEELIERGSPDHRFLWPLELAVRSSSSNFGYVMPLRDVSTVGLADLLTGRVDVPFSTLCTLGMELADAFLALHALGLCYRDISFGNVFFHPSTGRPLICDNDNVGVDGESTSSVLGTRRFMAPEIVRGEARPSTSTDLYSLSVLLFYVLMAGHPLVGRREYEFPVWDEHAELVLFGREPHFVFDPQDPSNRPVPAQHDAMLLNWSVFPDEIRRLFVQAFTRGLSDPMNGRVRESVWRAALARLRDTLVRCSACDKENFWRADGNPLRCWSCDRPVGDPIRLLIDGRVLILDSTTAVVRHHLALDYDFRTMIAQVVRHPTIYDRWGVRNESTERWNVTMPDGREITVDPLQSIGLVLGMRIRFGDGSLASVVG